MSDYPRYVYVDSNGVERVVRAATRWQAESTVHRVEAKRSGSIAAAEVAVRSLKLYGAAA